MNANALQTCRNVGIIWAIFWNAKIWDLFSAVHVIASKDPCKFGGSKDISDCNIWDALTWIGNPSALGIVVHSSGSAYNPRSTILVNGNFSCANSCQRGKSSGGNIISLESSGLLYNPNRSIIWHGAIYKCSSDSSRRESASGTVYMLKVILNLTFHSLCGGEAKQYQ